MPAMAKLRTKSSDIREGTAWMDKDELMLELAGAERQVRRQVLACIIHDGSLRNRVVAMRDGARSREAGFYPAWEFRRGCAPFVGILQGGWPPLVRVGEAGFRADPTREGGILDTVC
jgi:hypothetical protein